MASYFGAHCDFSLDSGSPPFAVFRNADGHRLGLPSFSPIVTKRQLELNAWHNTLYYKQHQQDCPIPSELLSSVMREESRGRMEECKSGSNGRNSVLGFQHEDHSLFVHTAGKCHDQLVLRYAEDLQPGLMDLPPAPEHEQPRPVPPTTKEFSSTSGFVLPLGGLQIEQVEAWGMTQYNTSSTLLVRSAHSLYHLQTLNLRDELSRLPPDVQEPIIPHFWESRPIILDPVQRWDLARGTIRCMTGSKSACSSSYFLVEDNNSIELHTICPEMGPRRVLAPGKSVFPESVLSTFAKGWKDVNIESHVHPQLCLLSHGDSLYMKDMRESSKCHLIVNAPICISSLLTMQQTNCSQSTESMNVRDDNYLFMGQDEDLVLMDLRHTRSGLAQRPVPGGTHFIRKATLPVQSVQSNNKLENMNKERDVIVTAGASGRQLFTHNLHLSLCAHGQSLRDESHFLRTSSIFGGNTGGVSWETAGWPIIDRADETRQLRGVDLLSLPPRGANYASGSDRQDTSVSGSDMQQDEGEDGGRQLESLFYRCQGVVVQQSATGDVFAQYLRCLPVVDDDVGGEEFDNEHDPIWIPGQHSATAAKMSRKRNRPKNPESGSHEKAPLQAHLPIGVRCPVFPNDDKRDRLIDSEGEDEEDTTGILARYDANTRIKLLRIKDKVNRLTGLGVRSALIPQDDEINVYPLGEKNILPILEDREMKRMSVVMLDPEELHIEPDHTLSADPSIKVVKVPYRILDKARLTDELLKCEDALLSTLETKHLTLYELWEWFVDRSGYDCDIEQLRQVLLDKIYSLKRDTTLSKQRKVSTPGVKYGTLEVMVFPPPPPSHEASADGLKMALIDKDKNGVIIPEQETVCECHNTLLRYLDQQRHTSMSGTCASVDENTESDIGGILSLDSISTCAQPSCLLIHCLGFKISGQVWPNNIEPLQNVAPSQVNPAYVAREQAVRDRIEAVQEAQNRTHVQVSDVTLELIDQLNGEWETQSCRV